MACSKFRRWIANLFNREGDIQTKSSDGVYSYNLLVLGDSKVGKSCFSSVNDISVSKVLMIDLFGFDCKQQILDLDNKRIKLRTYDSSNAEGFRGTIRSFYKCVDGIFIVYNVTNERSFNNLKGWLDDIRKYGSENVTKFLVGNKCDLITEKAVDFETAKIYAAELNISLIEVSVKNSITVEDAFKQMVLKIQSVSKSKDENKRNKLTGFGAPVKTGLCIQHEKMSCPMFKPYPFDTCLEDFEQNGHGDMIMPESSCIETETHTGMKHSEDMDEKELERAQAPTVAGVTIKETIKHTNEIDSQYIEFSTSCEKTPVHCKH
ncbi:hypothetical protein I4U23_026587 [Adineta vaga]|nr:hypothetical protein I4U23_026587 [Adineta vaga]